ncbi:L-threonine 3-dehydrogenase [Vulcanimicrobium alpinum]|uniref:L-threonine 3-dehydrogenase n=1 Tax=Vulcanimicrobium alpinum TaxID=3016050 RepID=A0AAN2CAD6_UNVUL|nr:L-threonine 3-dehydrogenase [Vulcanimicrobium alpinum]BDE06986.1 L-threonine 3-dehydrogenase [Vulcanimicrobium alpinum]
MTFTSVAPHRPLVDVPAVMRALRKNAGSPGFALEHVPVPGIGPNDVLIRVKTVGMCGTDLHIYGWDHWAQRRVKPPLTIGHECMGEVAAIGSAVRAVAVGDRVSAEGHLACGVCRLCRTGQAHICEHVEIIGVDTDGAFADYLRIPEENVWKLDPSIPDSWAAVFDPLGNAVHTVMAADVSVKSVVITGVGSIGLMAIPVARAAGAATVFAVDVNPQKLALAARVGADATFSAAQPDLVDDIITRTNGDGVDVLLEMSGSGSAIDSGLAMVRNGGVAALLGIPSDDVEINLAERIIFKGLTVLGINGRRMFETWYQTQSLVTSGRVDLTPIITHELPFEEFDRAFALMRSGEAAKIVLYLTDSR